MQRIVRNELCTDIEENINGIWAVVRCSLVLSNPPKPSQYTTVKKPSKANKNKFGKETIPQERKTTKEIRDINKLRTYGLTYDQYMEMVVAQDNKCAICKEPQPLHVNNGELNIDHCHKSGKVRGLLCNQCNTGIGMMKDDVMRMKNAIIYLEKNGKS